MDWKGLAAFFPEAEVEWKPQSVTKDGTRAMAAAYVDARAVMDRLDAVVGPGNWQDCYEPLPDGTVKCQLSVWDAEQGRWVAKEDVGGDSGTPKPGSGGGSSEFRMKAAFSDAFKRVAVKFGVGRYLYSLPPQWCPWDAAKKRFVTKPTLPAWAKPS